MDLGNLLLVKVSSATIALPFLGRSSKEMTGCLVCVCSLALGVSACTACFKTLSYLLVFKIQEISYKINDA